MSGNNQKTFNMPQLTDALQALRRDIFRSLNSVKVGQIVSFDGTKKTAQVKILFKRILPDNTIVDYPVLADCPVFTLQGGGGYIQMPIVPGDQCILLFSDRNIDAWFQAGSAQAPLDARCHDFSDGIALVGINSLNSTLDPYETAKMKVLYNGAGMEVDGAGIVKIENMTTTLLTLIDGLIDLLKTLQVQDPISGPTPLTAASIAALELQKAQFATLLG